MKTLTPKQQRWTCILEDWINSGLSQAEYCRQHHLCPKQFYWWKRHFAKAKSVSPEKAEFLPLVIENNSADSSIVLNVAGIQIHYQRDTDPALLVQLLGILRAAS